MALSETIYQPGTVIKSMQEKKLKELLSYLSNYSPFYKELFKKHKVNIADIKTLGDLPLLPTTTKEDLQQHNNDFYVLEKIRSLNTVLHRVHWVVL